MASFGATPFTSGMHVEYDWNGGTGDAPYWCEAVVVNVNPNGTYTIVLVENRVLLELVSMDDELRVGTTVSYNWRNSDTFYDYTVAKINEDDTVNLEMRQEEVEQIHLRPRANTEVFAVGEAAIYCWGGGDSWFDCVIQAVNPADGTYDVLMVDCDVPLALLAHPTGQPRGVEPRTNPVLPHSLQEGSVVDYNWGDNGYWYVGYVVKNVSPCGTMVDVQLVDKGVLGSMLAKVTEGNIEEEAGWEIRA